MRKANGNTLLTILLSTLQAAAMIATFYLISELLNFGSATIRGDYLIYVVTGTFTFMLHIKAMTAITSVEGPTSPLLRHSPMRPLVLVLSAALGALYTQLWALAIILFLYHALWTEVSFENLSRLGAMLLLAFASGSVVGMLFLSIRIWNKNLMQLLSQTYSRLSMLSSGQMFVANAVPGFLLDYLRWNPLFHIVDQARDSAFINYTAYHSSFWYPACLTLAAFAVAVLAGSYTGSKVSVSWSSQEG